MIIDAVVILLVVLLLFIVVIVVIGECVCVRVWVSSAKVKCSSNCNRKEDARSRSSSNSNACLPHATTGYGYPPRSALSTIRSSSSSSSNQTSRYRYVPIDAPNHATLSTLLSPHFTKSSISCDALIEAQCKQQATCSHTAQLPSWWEVWGEGSLRGSWTFDSGQSLVICSFPQTQPDVQHLSANKQATAVSVAWHVVGERGGG